MFILKRRRDSLNKAFVERTKKTRTRRAKKIHAEGLYQGVKRPGTTKVQIGSRSSSELDQDENLAGRETDGIGIKRVMSESTPVEYGHDFATLTGTLNR